MLVALLVIGLFLFWPLWTMLASRIGGVGPLLEASFAMQSVRVGDRVVPASALTVVHRDTGVAVTGDNGHLLQLDAQWLCRAPDGSWLVGIAQGMRDPSSIRMFGNGPLPIAWTWRHLPEERAQQLMKLRGIHPPPAAADRP